MKNKTHAKTIFFIVGNREIKYKGEYLNTEELKNKSEELFQNLNKTEKDIEIQIIPPFLNEFNIKKIMLIVTNQTDKKFEQKDTLFLGEIIKKILEKKGYEIEIIPYSDNPTDDRAAFNFFNERLPAYSEEDIVICSSGGTPQLKQALIICGINLLKKLEIYAVNDKTNELIEVEIKSTLKKEILKQSSIELIKNYDYAGAEKIIEEGGFSDPFITNLLSYARFRLYFDFESANEYLNRFLNSFNHSTKKKDFENLKINPNEKNKILELFYNMLIKYKRDEIADFFGRAYRLHEELCFYFFNLATNNAIDVSAEKKEIDKQFNKYLNENPELLEILESDKDIHKKDGAFEFNRLIILKLFSILRKKQEGAILNRLSKFISEKRNKSIIAHGMVSLTKKDIEDYKEYEGNKKQSDFIEDFKELLELGDIKVMEENPFDLINEKLIKLIQKR